MFICIARERKQKRATNEKKRRSKKICGSAQNQVEFMSKTLTRNESGCPRQHETAFRRFLSQLRPVNKDNEKNDQIFNNNLPSHASQHQDVVCNLPPWLSDHSTSFQRAAVSIHLSPLG